MRRSDVTKQIEFHDNQVFNEILGPRDINIEKIENRLNVSIAARGNIIAVTGDVDAVDIAIQVLKNLHENAQKHDNVESSDVEGALHMALSQKKKAGDEPYSHIEIQTQRRIIFPRTQTQSDYMEALLKNELVFGIGPAGTGKTYLAVAAGVSMLLSGKVDKIILSRPAVEAGERLGFLPDDMREKVDPYLRPLYDALNDMLPAEQVVKRMASGEIEIAPLAFMRGRTLSNAFIILDEAQNTTSMQMKMFLTRLGFNARMVVNGDLTQIDLPAGVQSGLKEAFYVLNKVEGLSFIRFSDEDVVRHPLVAKIVKAYEHTSTTK